MSGGIRISAMWYGIQLKSVIHKEELSNKDTEEN